MANLPVPTPASEQAGNLITGSIWNSNVYNGLTYLLNPPAAMLYQGTAQSLTNNTATAILFDSEALDSYNGHSTTSNTSRYTAQVTGYYFVYGTVTWASNSTGIRVCQIYKNGSPVNGAYTDLINSSFLSSAMTACIVQLNTNDYIEVYGNQNSGGALSTNTGAPCSAMNVWFIHA